MIVKMKKITVCSTNSKRKAILEYLHKKGRVEIETFETEESGIGLKDTSKSIERFETEMAQTLAAIEAVSEAAPEKKGFLAQDPPTKDYSLSQGEITRMSAAVDNINRLCKQIKENNERDSRLLLKSQALVPYMELDVPLGTRSTKETLIRAGGVDFEVTDELITEELDKRGLDDAVYEILSSGKRFSALWFIYPKARADEYEDFFREFGISDPQCGYSHLTPKDKAESIKAKRADIQRENESLTAKIAEFADMREDLKLYYDHILLRREKYEMLARLGITENAFIITGYIPEKYADNIQKEIEISFGAYVETEDAGEDAPTAFDNNAFVSPVESVTEDYSMPGRGDVDPNPIMSFFYYFFFGMMFSDAGYGLIMIIVCAFMSFGKRAKRKSAKFFRMFFYCGISTTIWGILYGSFFGDLIGTLSSTFGSGKLAFNPILLGPVEEPLTLLIICIAFGAVHILVALGIKLYMLWRDGERFAAIFDVGSWMLAIAATGVFAAGYGLGISALSTIGLGLLITAGAALVLTQGREKKNPVMKLMGGVISLYDVTSYVSDILSYSRLMTLGMATGVIASVINILGSLAGNLFVFILISLVGHPINFGINVLGAYVHTNRLQYVEFFQKFYEGGGRKFDPFRIQSKYFNFVR